MPQGSGGFPTTLTSEVIWCNNEIISTATTTLTGSGNQLRFFLGTSSTIDGTYSFEELSGIDNSLGVNVITHTFTATTGKFIKWRAIGLDYTLTQIRVRIN